MAVMFYGEGEHPAGFIGCRVATTLGEESEFRQRYFGLSEYSPAQAHSLAESLNRKWRTEAEAVKRARGLRQGRPKGGPGVLAMGFRAAFKVERGRKGHYGTYITPCFVVANSGYGKGEARFLTSVHGFDGAFAAAAEHYCKVYSLNDEERKILLAKKPSRDLFVHTLRLGLLKRGHIITAAEVARKLEGSS
ncbi:hypothetical protein [Pseudomonas luteola]|uniref:Uncharacterized protein n=1 Tax=Pseudomonas luteola TaxID=47886 RepID=A0ABS0FS00_PSELU|nr:hypothetical protein [Pseudomonas zeshuii]MBF8643076.1 hypothetical protein [Pseudomonas zeshuii]